MTTARIAVCSWSLGPDGPVDILTALDELGLDAVQLALSPLVHDPAGWPASIVARLRDRGVEIVSGMMAMAGEDYSTLAAIARYSRADRAQAAVDAQDLSSDPGLLAIEQP